uniref:Ion_trans domain-containing protein n=1 Tax=Macrostomum lignano TaxID=282301 RepID=A0A1I8FUF0_9PLAT
MNKFGEAALAELIERFGPGCLTSPDVDEITPLHLELNITNIIEEMTTDELCRTDIGGNTLLHSLMQSKLTYDGFEQHLLNRFKLLVEKGVDVEATNNLSLNCLHATKLDALVLCKLLDKVHSDETARSHFDKLLKEIKMTDIWRLLDPPRRALKLPNRSAARMTLVSITNDYSTKQQKTDKIVLIKALEMDSRKLFRAALSLNIITRETERQFTQYFIDTVTEDEEIQRAFSRQNTFKHLTHVDPNSELALLDLATFFHRDEILPDLILTRQFELIPCCLSLLIQLDPEIIKMRAKAKGKHEQLLQLKSKITNIAVNALNELFVNADSIEFELLFKYIKGEMKHFTLDSKAAAKKENRDCLGPKFPYRVFKDGNPEKIKYKSILDLVKIADNPDLFATDCIYSVTKEEWRQPISNCSKRGSSGNCCLPCDCCPSACSCRPKISRPDSPLASQVVLCVSYSLFCFRSVSFLSYFETVGPMINMLWNLIVYDLLPFLVVLFVIFSCFGVFFVCLLFSDVWTPTEGLATLSNGWETFVQAATIPLNLLFGNFDQIELSYSPDSTKLGKVAIKQGYEWFNYLIIFLFMGLVNVVMMNLLIALFNLRVTQIYGVAIGVWRKRFVQMLQEYRQSTLLPPPLSFLEYIFKFVLFIVSRCSKKFCTKNAVEDENIASADDKTILWWLKDKKDYPEEYNRFLKFQATQFRRCRSRLLRDTQWNRNDFDVVKAHTGKELSELKMDLQEMLDDANIQGQLGKVSYHRHDSLHQETKVFEENVSAGPNLTPKKKQETNSGQTVFTELKRQEQRIVSIESKLDQLLKLSQQQQKKSTKN